MGNLHSEKGRAKWPSNQNWEPSNNQHQVHQNENDDDYGPPDGPSGPNGPPDDPDDNPDPPAKPPKKHPKPNQGRPNQNNPNQGGGFVIPRDWQKRCQKDMKWCQRFMYGLINGLMVNQLFPGAAEKQRSLTLR